MNKQMIEEYENEVEPLTSVQKAALVRYTKWLESEGYIDDC